MKSLLLLVGAIALMSTSSSFAQSKISFGIGADVAMPITSGFSDTQGIGIGGTAKVYYPLNDPMLTLVGTAGYMTFAAKDFNGVKGGTWSQIPVVVGARYYFSPAGESMRFYGGFDMGLIFSSWSYTSPSYTILGVTYGGQNFSATGSDFTYQPQIGLEASKWDIAVRYLGVSGAASIAARIGYIFN